MLDSKSPHYLTTSSSESESVVDDVHYLQSSIFHAHPQASRSRYATNTPRLLAVHPSVHRDVSTYHISVRSPPHAHSYFDLAYACLTAYPDPKPTHESSKPNTTPLYNLPVCTLTPSFEDTHRLVNGIQTPTTSPPSNSASRVRGDIRSGRCTSDLQLRRCLGIWGCPDPECGCGVGGCGGEGM